MNSFKGIFKDLRNIENYFFLYFHSSGTASYKLRLLVVASVPTGVKDK